MKGLVRKIKDQQYTIIEVKVREATSNDKWGASTSLKQEIARATHDYQEYPRLFAMLWKRLGDVQHVMHCQKALLLIDYLLRNGAARFIEDCKQRARDIARLKKYKHYDANNEDDAKDARALAKQVYDLLMDDPRLTEERAKAEKLREKISSVSNETVDYKLRSSVRTDDPPATHYTTPATRQYGTPTTGATGVTTTRRASQGGDDWEAQPVEEPPKVEEAKITRAKKPKKTSRSEAAPGGEAGSASAAYSARVAPPQVAEVGNAAAYEHHQHQQHQQRSADPFAPQQTAVAADPFANYDGFAVSTPAVPAVRPTEVDFMSSMTAAPSAAANEGAWDPWSNQGGAPAAAVAPVAPAAPAKKDPPKDVWEVGGLADLDNLTGQKKPQGPSITSGGPSMASMRSSTTTLSADFLDPSFLAPSPNPPARQLSSAPLPWGAAPAGSSGVANGYALPGLTNGMANLSMGGAPQQYQQQQQAGNGYGVGVGYGGQSVYGAANGSTSNGYGAPVARDPFFPVSGTPNGAVMQPNAYGNPFGAAPVNHMGASSYGQPAGGYGTPQRGMMGAQVTSPPMAADPFMFVAPAKQAQPPQQYGQPQAQSNAGGNAFAGIAW